MPQNDICLRSSDQAAEGIMTGAKEEVRYEKVRADGGSTKHTQETAVRFLCPIDSPCCHIINQTFQQ